MDDIKKQIIGEAVTTPEILSALNYMQQDADMYIRILDELLYIMVDVQDRIAKEKRLELMDGVCFLRKNINELSKDVQADE